MPRSAKVDLVFRTCLTERGSAFADRGAWAGFLASVLQLTDTIRWGDPMSQNIIWLLCLNEWVRFAIVNYLFTAPRIEPLLRYNLYH